MTDNYNQLNIDKSNWVLIRLGELAEEISQKEENPSTSEYDRFVGLEHFVSGDLKIKDWKPTDDLVSATKVFRSGDILFARRNAYLKRASMVDFDGVCSGDAFVLREDHNKIEPGLLAFIVNSNSLWEYANSNAAGTMSKRVKWRDLAEYEFLLPPKDQQEKIAGLLWAMDDELESKIDVKNKIEISLNTYLKQIITSHIVDTEKNMLKIKSPFQTRYEKVLLPILWRRVLLKDVIEDVQNGFAEGKRLEADTQLRMNNVTRSGKIDTDSIVMIPKRVNIYRYKILEDDILFCNTNSEDLVGKSIIADERITDFTFSNHFTRLRPKASILRPKYLQLWLQYHFNIGLFERRCTKWIGQAAVQSENLLNLEIVLPVVEEQKYAEKAAYAFEKRLNDINSHIRITKTFQKSLINEIFSS